MESVGHSPTISETTIDTTTKYLPDIGIYKEAQNQKKIDISGSVCKLLTKIPKNSIFGNGTSRHAIFTTFCRIINIDVKKCS